MCDRSHPPFYPTNSREGNITLLNGREPQTETTKLVENSCSSGREYVTDTSSESLLDSKSSKNYGNNIPCNGSSNLDKHGLLNYLGGPLNDDCASDAGEESASIDKPNEGCFGGIKTESGGSDITDDPSAPATVCAGSCEIVGSSQLLSSDNLSGNEISEEFTCTFEANGVQSDELLAASKDKSEKENVIESMLSSRDNCTTDEPESSHLNGSPNVADALHHMSNVRLGESSIGPAAPVHQPNGTVSDACGNQCSAEVINKHLVSRGDESESNVHAFKDDITTDEVTCADVNSDPSFFEELCGVNDHLYKEGDQLPATSERSSPPSQQVFSSSEGYYYYDPYRWTPEEIKAATGNDECTSVEHRLKLRSVYTDVEVCMTFSDFGHIFIILPLIVKYVLSFNFIRRCSSFY
jgi:hypothetical protein